MTEQSTVPAPVAGGLRMQLRMATAGVHAELDRGLGAGSAWCDRAGYVAFLQSSLAVVAPLEDALQRGGFHTPGPPRAPLLHQDLAQLGASCTDRAAGAPFAIEDPAAAAGATYVLEGSRLGGQVVARHLASVLEPADRQFRYLTDPGANWPTVVRWLDDWGAQATPVEHARAATAAIAVFAAFSRSFAQTGLLP